MQTRRFWADGEVETQSLPAKSEDEVTASLVWRCRTLWYQLRCGKPGIIRQIDGLPDFAMVPLAAAGDEHGNLREMECQMMPLYGKESEWPGGIARVSFVACELRGSRSWFVSLKPSADLSRDVTDACRRFETFLTAALRLDNAMH